MLKCVSCTDIQYIQSISTPWAQVTEVKCSNLKQFDVNGTRKLWHDYRFDLLADYKLHKFS